jgi:hypothetical protein
VTAAKPTTEDLVAWLKLQSPPSDEAMAVYEECVTVAVEDIESRINLPDGTTDEDYPPKIRLAIILLASRLAKRSTSPEGVAGMSDLGAVVRILGTDPDIERLIRRHLKLDGFA